jgi:general secretion pathway protein K
MTPTTRFMPRRMPLLFLPILPHLRHQAGAALLAAMLTVTLVATLASAAMWQQYRSIEVEAAERARAQNAWVLTGALDWARLILREDARSGGADDLSEPWAVPLAEARLSTFLAAADQQASTDSGDSASDIFLSGNITDLQAKLNVANLVDGGKINDAGFRSFNRLFELLGLPVTELSALAENLRFALDTSPENRSGSLAPLVPQRLTELTWLGLSPGTVRLLTPYITLLPTRTAVNINTAGVEVIYASIAGLDLARAQRLVGQRQRTPFKTLTDTTQLLGSTIALNSAEHATGTRFFEVRGRLRTPRGVVEEQSLIQRDGLDVRILRRERVVPQWATPPI